jgi:hypothetical protein
MASAPACTPCRSIPVPPLIRLISRALRRMYLYEHRESIEMPATVRDGGKWALDTLQKIATPDGGMVLVGVARTASPGGPTPTSGSVDPDITRVFGRKNDPLGG